MKQLVRKDCRLTVQMMADEFSMNKDTGSSSPKIWQCTSGAKTVIRGAKRIQICLDIIEHLEEDPDLLGRVTDISIRSKDVAAVFNGKPLHHQGPRKLGCRNQSAGCDGRTLKDSGRIIPAVRRRVEKKNGQVCQTRGSRLL